MTGYVAGSYWVRDVGPVRGSGRCAVGPGGRVAVEVARGVRDRWLAGIGHDIEIVFGTHEAVRALANSGGDFPTPKCLFAVGLDNSS